MVEMTKKCVLFQPGGGSGGVGDGEGEADEEVDVGEGAGEVPVGVVFVGGFVVDFGVVVFVGTGRVYQLGAFLEHQGGDAAFEEVVAGAGELRRAAVSSEPGHPL